MPQHLRRQLLEENNAGPLGGHFSGSRLYNALILHWWWERMYSDAVEFGKSCPECAFATGVGRRHNPPLHPIPVQRPFQILGVDIMDLPRTEQGNKHVIVFQDFFTKWPFVFAIPDQKTERIAKLLAQEIIPFFGVPEALLSDRGTNLLSHLVLDLCDMLGIKKLNATSYHPQCKYLSGILWSYRNTRHSSTGEKPSFLLLGRPQRLPSCQWPVCNQRMSQTIVRS